MHCKYNIRMIKIISFDRIGIVNIMNFCILLMIINRIYPNEPFLILIFCIDCFIPYHKIHKELKKKKNHYLKP